MVFKSILFHFARFVDITSVDDERIFHQFLDSHPAGHPEFLPFGKEQQGVGFYHRVVYVFGIMDGIAYAPFRLGHGHGVVGIDVASGFEELMDDNQRRCLAHIVRLRLEGQTPDSNPLSFQIALEIV